MTREWSYPTLHSALSTFKQQPLCRVNYVSPSTTSPGLEVLYSTSSRLQYPNVDVVELVGASSRVDVRTSVHYTRACQTLCLLKQERLSQLQQIEPQGSGRKCLENTTYQADIYRNRTFISITVLETSRDDSSQH